MTDQTLTQLRRDYTIGSLSEHDLPTNPLELFSGWLQLAMDRSIPDANAMFLSTLDRDGYPTGRIVLLRDANESGMSFFTNYQSAKGAELAGLSKASLGFFWSTLERQIRVRGHISTLTSAESDAYFASRPRESQIGAWSSPQSEVIADRASLEENVAKYSEKFRDSPHIPRPPHWGGYKLVPDTYEFWQGRANRLHDRFRAQRQNAGWKWERLAP